MYEHKHITLRVSASARAQKLGRSGLFITSKLEYHKNAIIIYCVARNVVSKRYVVATRVLPRASLVLHR